MSLRNPSDKGRGFALCLVFTSLLGCARGTPGRPESVLVASPEACIGVEYHLVVTDVSGKAPRLASGMRANNVAHHESLMSPRQDL